ncbi:MAG: DUF2917 domain-containing protein [Burkholderiaceae bacterium]
MTHHTPPFLQQSRPASQALPGTWKLGAGRAVTLQPREGGLVRIAHGRVWVTFDGPHDSLRGDLFLCAGEGLAVEAGQRAVMESFGSAHDAPAYFTWEPAAGRAPAGTRWHAAVVQPLADLRLALGSAGFALRGAVAAVGRLAAGVAGFAFGAAFGRRALTAQASACRAHGAMS